MSEFGNGIAWPSRRSKMTSISSMSSGALPRKSSGWLDGVVDAGMRRHGGQAQGGAKVDAVDGHLVHAVFHCGETLHRRVAGSVHLVSQLLHQHFQLVKFGVAGCKVQGSDD
jgi:hypothetical protein